MALAVGMVAAAALLAAGSPPRRRLTSDYVRPASSELVDPAEVPPNTACADPPCSSQVHVTLGGPGEAVVSFASAGASTPSKVSYGSAPGRLGRVALGTAVSYSQLLSFDENLLRPAIGLPGATEQDLLDVENTSSWAQGSASYHNPTEVQWGLQDYKNPQAYYGSPVLHHVALRDLSPGDRVYYSPANDARVHSFVYPPGAGSGRWPLRLGLTADLGQTPASNRSMHHLLAARPDAVLLAGDLSYADGWYARWDSFGDLFEPLASAVPVLTCGGNHEVGSSEQWLSYNARWRMPALASGSTDNTYWAREVGPAHVIALNSYAPTHAGSLQRTWLEGALARVDRARTPWLVVMMHAPWYCSNVGHYEETRLMRRDMESLFIEAGVDVVLNGHVHSYERTLPVAEGRPDPCGPVYLNLGDGGNREGTYVPWREPQPEWSAYREASFGVGVLDFINETHARYEWRRHSCQGSRDPANINFNRTCESIARGVPDNGDLVGSDEAVLLKPEGCPARFRSGARPAPGEEADAPGARHALALVGIGLGILLNLMILCCLLLFVARRAAVHGNAKLAVASVLRAERESDSTMLTSRTQDQEEREAR